MSDNNVNILVYQQDVPMMFMELKHYNAGNVELNKKGQEIKVSDSEKRFLLKLTNGNPKKGGKPIFKLKEEPPKRESRPVRREIKEELKEVI